MVSTLVPSLASHIVDGVPAEELGWNEALGVVCNANFQLVRRQGGFTIGGRAQQAKSKFLETWCMN